MCLGLSHAVWTAAAGVGAAAACCRCQQQRQHCWPPSAAASQTMPQVWRCQWWRWNWTTCRTPTDPCAHGWHLALAARWRRACWGRRNRPHVWQPLGAAALRTAAACEAQHPWRMMWWRPPCQCVTHPSERGWRWALTAEVWRWRHPVDQAFPVDDLRMVAASERLGVRQLQRQAHLWWPSHLFVLVQCRTVAADPCPRGQLPRQASPAGVRQCRAQPALFLHASRRRLFGVWSSWGRRCWRWMAVRAHQTPPQPRRVAVGRLQACPPAPCQRLWVDWQRGRRPEAPECARRRLRPPCPLEKEGVTRERTPVAVAAAEPACGGTAAWARPPHRCRCSLRRRGRMRGWQTAALHSGEPHAHTDPRKIHTIGQQKDVEGHTPVSGWGFCGVASAPGWRRDKTQRVSDAASEGGAHCHCTHWTVVLPWPCWV